MFEYRSQPLKSIYLLFSSLTLLFIKLPYWLLRYSLPSFRQRRTWGIGRAVAVPLIDSVVRILYGVSGTDDIRPLGEGKGDEKRKRELGFVWVPSLSEFEGGEERWIKGEILEMAEVNGVRSEKRWGYWFGKRGSGEGGEGGEKGEQGQRAEKGEKVLFHLHGGGYTRGSGSPKSETASIPSSILTSSPGLIDRAFCLDYRLASSAPFEAKSHFPSQLIDALAGYLYLLEKVGFRAEDVVVSGDSAGGHLAVALVRYIVLLNQLGEEGCPVPGGLLLFSPTTDWGCTHDEKEGSSMKRNWDSDFVSAVLQGGYTAASLLGNLPPSDITQNAWLSPASLLLKEEEVKGMFKGFPKTCVIAGGAEQTVDGMRTFRDRLVGDLQVNLEGRGEGGGGEGEGGEGEGWVRYLEWEDAVHDFVGLSFHEPERGEALGEIRKWLEEEVGGGRAVDSPV